MPSQPPSTPQQPPQPTKQDSLQNPKNPQTKTEAEEKAGPSKEESEKTESRSSAYSQSTRQSSAGKPRSGTDRVGEVKHKEALDAPTKSQWDGQGGAEKDSGAAKKLEQKGETELKGEKLKQSTEGPQAADTEVGMGGAEGKKEEQAPEREKVKEQRRERVKAEGEAGPKPAPAAGPVEKGPEKVRESKI